MEVVGVPSRLHRSVNFQLTDGRNVRATSDSTIMYLLKYMSPGEKKRLKIQMSSEQAPQAMHVKLRILNKRIRRDSEHRSLLFFLFERNRDNKVGYS